MICSVCKDGIEGIWDPSRSRRLAKHEELDRRWGRGPRPRAGFAEYLSSLSGARDDLAGLEPTECIFAHQKDRALLLTSIRDGCVICNKLGRGPIEESFRDAEHDSGFLLVFRPIIRDGFPLRFSFYTRDDWFWISCTQIEDTKDDENMNYEFERSNHGPRTWSVVEKWMTDCTESHPTC